MVILTPAHSMGKMYKTGHAEKLLKIAIYIEFIQRQLAPTLRTAAKLLVNISCVNVYSEKLIKNQ
jgi:hypothetical protein